MALLAFLVLSLVPACRGWCSRAVVFLLGGAGRPPVLSRPPDQNSQSDFGDASARWSFSLRSEIKKHGADRSRFRR
jgi:hypothetical protein